MVVMLSEKIRMLIPSLTVRDSEMLCYKKWSSVFILSRWYIFSTWCSLINIQVLTNTRKRTITLARVTILWDPFLQILVNDQCLGQHENYLHYFCFPYPAWYSPGVIQMREYILQAHLPSRSKLWLRNKSTVLKAVLSLHLRENNASSTKSKHAQLADQISRQTSCDSTSLAIID